MSLLIQISTIEYNVDKICLIFFKSSNLRHIQRTRGPKIWVAGWHCHPESFLRVRKVFARITEKYLVNCPNTFKTTQIFPDDCQFSGLFQNCPDFSRWQPIFRIISKLSGFFQMTANFPDDFKTVQMFQVTANFPDDFKTVQIFPDDCQFSR